MQSQTCRMPVARLLPFTSTALQTCKRICGPFIRTPMHCNQRHQHQGQKHNTVSRLAHEGEVEKEMGLWQAVKNTSKYATSACT